MGQAVAAAGERTIAARLRRDVSLAPYTTVRIGGAAELFFEPFDASDAAAGLRHFAAAGIPWRVLGGGSNLLVGDGCVRGVVVHPVRLQDVEICGETVLAGAGAALSAVIAKSTDAGLGGLEGLAGIPGQIGGAVAMNAGGRWGEIKDAVESVDLALEDGRIKTVGAADLHFGYRKSEVPRGSMVVRVRMRLVPGDRRELKKKAGSILKEKNAAQPTTAWNFGCMFKNPKQGSAGKLVESCGLKGMVHGGARISPLHGNFVENLEAATARDVVALMETAERAVLERHGIALEREVRVWES